MDCKFNIGDYVYYRGNKPHDIYLVVGRTEYSRKKTIYCGKDRLVHEPTYELINIFYVKGHIIKEIGDIYGIPMFTNCREHHMVLKESRVGDIHTIPFKFNLNDYVTLKNGSISYKITSRTEQLDGGNPIYELMRITESGHVYFEYYSEELINEKICIKEVADNFKKIGYELYEEECKKLEEDMKNMDKSHTYLCDPEKNVNCPKDICQALGRGECMYTSNPEFALNPNQPEYVINESFKKKQTNQDKLAEMVRTEDPMILADRIYDHTVCSTVTTPSIHYCPLAGTCTKQGSQSKMECIYDICDWLKEGVEDGL